METLLIIILILIAIILVGIALPIIVMIFAAITVPILTVLIWITETFTRWFIWPYQRYHAKRLGITRPQVGILQRTHLTPWPTHDQAERYLAWLHEYGGLKNKRQYRINGWKRGDRRMHRPW